MGSDRTLHVVMGWLGRLLCIAVLFAGGIALTRRLIAMKKPPARKPTDEKVHTVEAVAVRLASHTVRLSGYGNVRVAAKLEISPELKGRVTTIHPRLEVGEIIGKGELLLAVDPRDYELSLRVNTAERQRLNAEIKRLEAEVRYTGERLDIRRQRQALSRRDVDRVKKLLEGEDIGTAAELDRAEKDWLQDREGTSTLESLLAQLPLQVETLRAQLRRTEATLALDELQIARCQVRAPFRGRVLEAQLELGQLVLPGQTVAVLADDDSREISVPIPAAQATRWLRFDNGADRKQNGWFHNLEQAPVEIVWVDAPEATPWAGRLDRVESLDRKTRMVRVVVAVAGSADDAYPLVEGMFCEVRFPGRRLEGVTRIPRAAVNENSEVFVVAEGRLESRRVRLIHELGDEALVDQGLADGDMVVVSKLASPLLGMRIRVRNRATE